MIVELEFGGVSIRSEDVHDFVGGARRWLSTLVEDRVFLEGLLSSDRSRKVVAFVQEGKIFVTLSTFVHFEFQ